MLGIKSTRFVEYLVRLQAEVGGDAFWISVTGRKIGLRPSSQTHGFRSPALPGGGGPHCSSLPAAIALGTCKAIDADTTLTGGHTRPAAEQN